MSRPWLSFALRMLSNIVRCLSLHGLSQFTVSKYTCLLPYYISSFYCLALFHSLVCPLPICLSPILQALHIVACVCHCLTSWSPACVASWCTAASSCACRPFWVSRAVCRSAFVCSPNQLWVTLRLSIWLLYLILLCVYLWLSFYIKSHLFS